MATSAGATRPADQITFAHNSERQFARLLDFYRVEWEYEPTAFPIEWDAAGQPVQHFRPDFYLPGFDLYIEITTLNQRLVTKKNRKVRRLRELYPDVRIKVLYQRDYLSLLAKYGLEPPSQMAEPDPRSLAAPSQPGVRPGALGFSAVPASAGPGTGVPAPADGRPPEGSAMDAAPADGPSPQGSGSRSDPADGRAGERGWVRADAAAGRAGKGIGMDPDPRDGRASEGSGVGGDRAEGPAGGIGLAVPGTAAGQRAAGPGSATERARAAGRPRVVPDPPRPVPPLPADPELVRLARVPLPAELARQRARGAKRAG